MFIYTTFCFSWINERVLLSMLLTCGISSVLNVVLLGRNKLTNRKSLFNCLTVKLLTSKEAELAVDSSLWRTRYVALNQSQQIVFRIDLRPSNSCF